MMVMPRQVCYFIFFVYDLALFLSFPLSLQVIYQDMERKECSNLVTHKDVLCLLNATGLSRPIRRNSQKENFF